MSAKFKPKRREAEAVVDEWDASDSDNEEAQVASASAIRRGNGIASTARVCDAWDDVDGDPSLKQRPQKQQQSRQVWDEANRTAPQAEPVLLTSRGSLPTTLLAPRLASNALPSTSTSASLNHVQSHASEYDVRPSPQILRRDPNVQASTAGAGAGKDGARKKTLAEREEEYQRARERIFGSAGEGATKGKIQNGSGSGSDSGGRTSPAMHVGRRKR